MFNLKFALSYFLHQLKAINRHGLHSPFVYRLVDEVIYGFSDKKVYFELEKALKPYKKLNEADKLLFRIIADWQPLNVSVIGECAAADRIILDHASKKLVPGIHARQSDSNSLNTHFTVFVDAAMSNSFINELEQLLVNMQEGTMLVIKNNHGHSHARLLWKRMKADPNVTVSIDLFWLGLIFHRPGKVKEDFLIKF
jgi:hypothetical protein